MSDKLRLCLLLSVCALPLASAATVKSTAPAYHKEIEPILQRRCQGCHRPGEAAPFSMLTYKETRPWAKAMKQAAVSRKMPPWMADEGVGNWKNNASLTASELDVLVRWADAGAPEGDAKDAPKPVEFVEGWNIGKPDAVFEMPEPFDVPAQGTIEYQWVVLPTGFTEDKWISAFEVRPGDRSVVHHVIAFYRKPGSKWLADAKPGIPTPKASGSPETGMSDGSLGGFAPGIPPRSLAPGRAMLLPAGSDIVLQLHYTASGKAAKDRTKFGIIFAKEAPKERFYGLAVVNGKFVIPPGEPNYRVDAEFTLDRDTKVIDFTPHMHLRGKAFEYRAVLPDGTVEDLLKISRYDFNWQLTYEPSEERVFPAGTKIQGSAWFDNSPNNPFNPDPKAEVRFGDQTWDEMMVGFLSVAIDPSLPPSKLIRRPPQPQKPAEKPQTE
jgi:hypothetical protein